MKSETIDPDSTASRRDAYAALRVRDFRRLLAGNLLSVLGLPMQTVAVGWQLYEKISSAWALGNVGLVQVVPMIGFAMIAGHVADRFDRRKLLMAATVLAMASAFGLAVTSLLGENIFLVYLFLFLSGTARAFQNPARSS